jgi:uncharacterized damage-inducible protein DinB
VTEFDDHGRPEPPVAGDEAETLLGFLDFQRATLRWKCAGLDATGLRATTARTAMTLAGILKHMAFVEDLWFSKVLHGREPAPPWDTVDWDADHDWEWLTAVLDPPDDVWALWAESVARARVLVADAIADGGLGRPATRAPHDGPAVTLRWILVHMIEEYARHNGHADLLRESVDGSSGE